MMNRLLGRAQRTQVRKNQKAERRSKVLLHEFLTKQQRLELKKTEAFTMQAADGQTYRITKGSCNNVKLLVDGEVTASYCVVFKNHERLPVFDLMLAQKLWLENDPEGFKAIAYVYGPQGGGPIRRPLGVEAPPPVVPAPVLEIAEEDLEDPRAWIQERLTA